MTCPECGSKVHKAGMCWSGRKKIQNWMCSKCGRHTVVPKEDK
jgi:predicted RNA-binding Zn-ribbon protein involved in translation (DUF1610 family)